MPQITFNIPEDKMLLLKEVTDALGIEESEMVSSTISPEWHKLILDERFEKYQTGHSKLTSWEDFENKVNEKNQGI